MNQKVILVIGKKEFLISNNDWDVITVSNAEAAIEKFHQVDIEVVVFANAMQEDELKLRKLFSFQQPGIIMLQIQNEDLFTNQIKEALDKKQQANKPSISFVDDALKAAELPITIQ